MYFGYDTGIRSIAFLDPFENKITSTINAKKGKRMGCLIASFGFVGLLFGIAVSFGITFKGFYTNFSLTRNPYISDGYIQRAIQKEIQNTTLREYMEDLTRQSHFQGEQGLVHSHLMLRVSS